MEGMDRLVFVCFIMGLVLSFVMSLLLKSSRRADGLPCPMHRPRCLFLLCLRKLGKPVV